MRTWTSMAVTVSCLAALPAAAQAPVQARDDGRQAVQPPLSLRLTDEVIGKAVRETLAEEDRKGAKRDMGKALSADTAYRKFERDFSAAQKPGCLGPDATRFQPSGTVLNTPLGKFNVGVGGIFALPFWAAAVARGKCN